MSDETWLEQAVGRRLEKGVGVSVYCRRLDGRREIRWQDKVMPSASLIKVPILVCAFRREKEGLLSFAQKHAVYDAVEGGSFFDLPLGAAVSLWNLLFHMIVESDNTCTNMLIDLLGFDAVNEEIRHQGMAQTVLRRKMMDFEAAAAGKENVTTAADMGRLFLRLAQGRCLDPERDKMMRQILAAQEDNCILPAQIPHNVAVEHKTGQLDGIYHDCGLVWKPGGPYVCCLMADHIHDEPKALYDLSYLGRDIYDHM